MPSENDDERKEKKGYEPPRLFDLSGGGAYIGAKKGRSGTDCKRGHGATDKCHQGMGAANTMDDSGIESFLRQKQTQPGANKR